MKREGIRFFSLMLLSCLSSVFAGDFMLEDIDGFVEARTSFKPSADIFQHNNSLAELRLQVGTEQDVGEATLMWTTDFIADSIDNERKINLESGRGAIDQRQLNISFPLTDNIDVKFGRQILTWGTSDMTFINDLFPKDYKSFFLGRNDEYLKVPSDAIKVSVFTDLINVNIVYTPRFNADRFISGERISFFDTSQNTYRGKNDTIEVNKPDDWFSDDELAVRLYRNLLNAEAALYLYDGYWKSPTGVDNISGKFIFPTLRVFGASVRSPFATGIANVEFGYYQSEQQAKSNPLLRNSDLRLLLGFEKEVAKELTAGIQYNLTRMLDYDAYLNVLPENSTINDENHHLVTIRLTKMLFQQDLKLSMFNFYVLSDKDGYLRFNVLYKLVDDLSLEGGGNYFYGKNKHTSFNRFDRNNNLYTAMRYSY